MKQNRIFFDTDVIVNWLTKETETIFFEVVIPDTTDMLQASSLQSEYPLDPFDAIHLALCLSLKPVVLVSRDKEFLEISKKFISAYTPEDFLSANSF